MKHLLLLPLLLTELLANAQKREEFFDVFFKPTSAGGYYFVVTEKKDSGWYREGWYVSQRTAYLKGWYKDEACSIPHGPVSTYHPTRFLHTKGRYANGRPEGLWLGYDDQGRLNDSATYRNGHRTGINYRWHKNGTLSDSITADGNGNSAHVSWDGDGYLASAGRWTGDTLKTGRWQHYHKNGQVMATADYANGKLSACNCYDEAGTPLDTALCREKEAVPGGGLTGWRHFLEQNLLRLVERKAASREWSVGQRTVMVRFVVEKDGSLGEFAPLTAYGQGVEDEVIRFLKKAPRWTPGRQWGQPVRNYHTQPITFQIQNP